MKHTPITKKARKSSRDHSLHNYKHNFNRIPNTKIPVATRQRLFHRIMQRLFMPFANMKLFDKPIPEKGHQGFWKWEDVA